MKYCFLLSMILLIHHLLTVQLCGHMFVVLQSICVDMCLLFTVHLCRHVYIVTVHLCGHMIFVYIPSVWTCVYCLQSICVDMCLLFTVHLRGPVFIVYSPANLTYEDTYNTLRYANRAKEIKVHVIIIIAILKYSRNITRS